MEGDNLEMINPKYYKKIKVIESLLNPKTNLTEEQGWWGMDPTYVQTNKGKHAKKLKTDSNGTYNLLLKAAAEDRDDIVNEIYGLENSLKLQKPAKLCDVSLKPGFDCLHTAIACKSDKVVDLLIPNLDSNNGYLPNG